jgi:hypothetical protein
MKRCDWRKHRICHAKVRAAERYGEALTRQDLKNIVGMIQNQKSRLVRRVSTSKRIHAVVYNGVEMLALYSARHQEIITFLPPEVNRCA